jgi:bifunctional non-homologous end joining protein LigD
MRQPIFLGLREDKSAHTVRREVPRAQVAEQVARATPVRHGRSAPKRSSQKTAVRASRTAGSSAVSITHPEKVFWPDEGYTKGVVIAYYREVAPVILNYLRDRPESLHRHPNGIAGKSFFQKDVSRQRPPAPVETVMIAPESGEPDIRYLLCQNEESLLYLANLGCIELNPWHSRITAFGRTPARRSRRRCRGGKCGMAWTRRPSPSRP